MGVKSCIYILLVFVLQARRCTEGKDLQNNEESITCDCPNTLLVSEGGFAEKYPRYVGTWFNVGTYHDLPLYMCLQGCQALNDKMVSIILCFDIKESVYLCCRNLHSYILINSRYF